MNIKEKAQLVIDLLKEYLKYTDTESYMALCNGYNPETDLEIWDNPLPIGEFSFTISDGNVVLDIAPTGILKVYCNNPTEVHKVVSFLELCGSCITEEERGSWNKAIEYMKRANK